MLALIASVFVASLLGSLHCAGMCGAFVVFAVGLDDPAASKKRARLHAAYNAGRLVTYMAMGAIAGALGSALDLAGSMVGVSRVAAAVAGATLILFGGTHLLRALGVRIAPARPPKFLLGALRRAHRAAMALPPVRRAVVIGLMTTLLPCGWLYAFVAASAGTGSAAYGSLTMAVFWLGTLPVLVAVGTGIRALSGPLASRLPVVLPLLVICAGLFTISSRLGVSPEALEQVAGRVRAASLSELADHVGDLDSGAMPCCTGEAGAPMVDPMYLAGAAAESAPALPADAPCGCEGCTPETPCECCCAPERVDDDQ